jgi:hypothetical protein
VPALHRDLLLVAHVAGVDLVPVLFQLLQPQPVPPHLVGSWAEPSRDEGSPRVVPTLSCALSHRPFSIHLPSFPPRPTAPLSIASKVQAHSHASHTSHTSHTDTAQDTHLAKVLLGGGRRVDHAERQQPLLVGGLGGRRVGAQRPHLLHRDEGSLGGGGGRLARLEWKPATRTTHQIKKIKRKKESQRARARDTLLVFL